MTHYCLKASKMAETECFGTQARYTSPPYFDPKYLLPHPHNLVSTDQNKPGTSAPFNAVYYMKALKLDNGSVIISFPKASLVSIK